MSQSKKASERRRRRMSLLQGKLSKQNANIDPKTLAVFTRKGYLVQTILGAGSFGAVYKAIRIAEPRIGDLCAVKVLDLELISAKYKQKFLPREMRALMQIKHEYIIRTYDIFRSNKRIYIFMEYAANGDVAQYLKKNGLLTEDKARVWFTQISQAMEYLHESMYTAHRDIKIDNILLNAEWITKLTDFGFAVEAADEEGTTVLSKTYCGTMPYYSPQILMKKIYSPFAADVWAAGVVIYAMTHNKFPFHFRDPRLMIKEQLSVEFIQSRIKKSASKELRDMIEHLLQPDEEKRYKFTDILKCDWITQGMPPGQSPSSQQLQPAGAAAGPVEPETSDQTVDMQQ